MPHLPRAQARTQTMGHLLFCLAGVSSLLSPASGAQDASERPRITAVRHWSMDGVTRIAVEATGEFKFTCDRLHAPERIFFDLIGTTPQLRPRDGRGMTTIGVGDRFVRQIRVAETPHGVTRIVLDLASNAEFSTSQLANPDRLIIEMHSPSAGLRSQFAPPAARTVATPTVLDPPSPFDRSMRYATRAYNGPDPLADMPWSKPPTLPRPPYRTTRPAQQANLTRPAERTEEAGLPAKPNSRGETMTRILGLKLERVVIDPGHGGNDAGTIGPDGLREKDVVLDIARRLGALLEARLGSEVVFTRADDTFIPLSRRTAIANEKKADLFLSIHVNSSPVRAVSGVETYYLSLTGSKSSLEIAMRENAGSQSSISELQDLLKKIALTDKVNESREFAGRIQNSMLALSPRQTRAAKDRGVKRAPFVVLIGASMPSVLAEVGFISNSQDANQMRRSDYRQRIAEALYRGVASYSNSLSHFQVAQRPGVARASGQGAQ